MEQLDIFSLMYEKYSFNKPIRLIELFAGYGSQSLSLDYLGVEYQSKIDELLEDISND